MVDKNISLFFNCDLTRTVWFKSIILRPIIIGSIYLQYTWLDKSETTNK